MIPLLHLVTAVVIAQAAPMPSAAPTPLPAAWRQVALENADQYAHYDRREQDGTDSILSATRRVCDCQPDTEAEMLVSTFGSIRGAHVANTSTLACGEPAVRFVATGLASRGNTLRNVEVLLFRDGPALYMVMYSFRYSRPMLDAESAMLSLCPQGD